MSNLVGTSKNISTHELALIQNDLFSLVLKHKMLDLQNDSKVQFEKSK